ncbi:MAG: transposase [Pseudomonadota bacterium]
MTRPLRIQFPGALYHVMARGDRRRPIFHRDDDFRQWLARLGLSCERFNAVVHAYCLMPNHYHLLIETPDANLSRVVGYLNASYSQLFNRRYDQVGHVFQGRFKSILVQRDTYLLELARYIMLNPVRAMLTQHASDWPWSSLALMLAGQDVPAWFDRTWLLTRFSEREEEAKVAFREFMVAGIGGANPLESAKHQLVLGDAAFVVQHVSGKVPADMKPILKSQRGIAAMTLEHYVKTSSSRNEAMSAAYRSKAFTMRQIAQHFKTNASTVSRAIRAFDAAFPTADTEKCK